ncbi:uncharacterized protein Dyak_GE10461 [Drosophila yakuba]|uniref:Aminopeptidase N-like N-terminal domain-containing protein n=1 Tax=Drosophila yakuba TaxID=7245 RepID=A0A0R1E7U1_DROYA|nr:uncharacterized protein Dyak_GE10461 [Drosophila yakuba]
MNWLPILVAAFWLLGLVESESSYDYYRLPTALRPQKYDLRILTLLEHPENLRFSGTAKIVIEVLQNTNNITLHAKNLHINESQIVLKEISVEGNTDICISSTEVNSIHDFYILNTCKELLTGRVYELSLPFSAELNTQLEGYYRSSYVDPVTNETRYVHTYHMIVSTFKEALPDGSPLRSSPQRQHDRHSPVLMSRHIKRRSL